MSHLCALGAKKPRVTHYIYKVTNKINGKAYIGLTVKSIGDRWAKHLEAARAGSVNAMHLAIRKHGADQFTVEILDSSESHTEAQELEKHYIATHRTHGSLPLSERGYNLTHGGDALEAGRRPPPSHLSHLAGTYYEDTTSDERESRADPCSLSIEEKLVLVSDWADSKAPASFDASFVWSLEEQYENRGELSSAQEDALDRIILKWRI